MFQSTFNLWALCGFSTMPCVISWWSPNLVSIVFVTTESNLGQYPFTLDDTFFHAANEGKKFLDCVWVRLLPIRPKNHIQKRSYLTSSSCCAWGGEKNLESMGEVAIYRAKSLHKASQFHTVLAGTANIFHTGA